MYVAKIDDQELTLEASGKLWMDALVMADDQTGSLWSQVSGECISGKYLGRKLTPYPSAFTSFAEARNKPNVVFLSKPEKGEGQSPYKKYFENRGRLGIFGTIFEDSLLEAKDLVFGLRNDDSQIAVPSRLFGDKAAYSIDLNGVNILIISDGGSQAYGFILPEEKDYNPVITGDNRKLIVSNNGSSTDRIVIEGGRQVEGQNLEAYPIVTAFWFAWKSFFPATRVFNP